ncbi:glycosyltransferase family 9 protein [Chloroflexia bacterium SDU3-3]|nr:glycosyltransferase family 9 protein [Chloroflexia bacterium SDU3-3]
MRFLRLMLLHALALVARRLARRPSDDPAHILFIKPDHLGDVLLATPALAALRARYPDARITALVGPWSRPMLERSPHIDTLQTCPFPGFERERAQRGPLARLLWPYAVLLRQAALLRAARYDIAIVARDDHWWGAALALLAGVPRRVGFATPECAPLLTDALPWNPAEHVTRQALALVGHLRPPAPGEMLMRTLFRPAPQDIAWADAWLAARLGQRRLVIIQPGTGGAAKHWLDERWAEVGDALAEDDGLLLVMAGGPGEEERAGRIMGAMRQMPLDLVGKTSLGQLAALMARAALVLGVDSGPLHLAAAAGAPTVQIYGPGNERRFGPWGHPGRHTVLRAELWCRPCGVLDACPRGLATPECMAKVPARQLLAAAASSLARETR